MAKEKKKLMIPFTYYQEEMIDYVGYTYEQYERDPNKIYWSIEENKQVRPPYTPRKPSDNYQDDWYYRGIENWTKAVEEYPIKLETFHQEEKAFNNKVQNGMYISVNNIVWKENYEFEDTLELTGMSRGRSAANFNLKSISDKRNYNLFMTDTVDLIQNGVINKGKITGKWTFCKRGANYGIKLLP